MILFNAVLSSRIKAINLKNLKSNLIRVNKTWVVCNTKYCLLLVAAPFKSLNITFDAKEKYCVMSNLPYI